MTFVECPLFAVCPWGPLCTPNTRDKPEGVALASRGQPLDSVGLKPEPAFLWFPVGRP